MTASRFRFRVWNTISKEMTFFAEPQFDFMPDVEGGEFTGKAPKPCVTMREFTANKIMLGGYTDIMQSTGCMDTANRGIFEGDVVLVDDGGDTFPVKYNTATDEYEPCGRYIVKWMGSYPAFDLVNLNGSSLDLEWNPFTLPDCRMTVLGNIHENPELLKG